MYKELTLSGWGRVRRSASAVARPERMRDVEQVFAGPDDRRICGRGAGRSYGDCALNSGGVVVLTERLNRILSFDEVTGAIAVEPGVTFRQLLQVFLPRGWIAPVSPGTGFVTIGGAVANDVHGKNHEKDGSFGQHVTELDVMTPDGLVHTIGPEVKPAWFRATVGGAGLTGFVTRIAFRMMRVPGPGLMVVEKRIPDLDAFFAAFEHSRSEYSVGWIDALSRGKAMGRGIFETGTPSPDAKCAAPGKGPRLAMDLPNLALNPFTVSAFNALYFRKLPAGGRTRPRHFMDFLYPLDSVEDWNGIYGRRGFHQFQCVVPVAQSPKAIALLLEEIGRSRGASFITALKRLGSGRTGYLSFPMEGYTLAVDFPNSGPIEDLHARLMRIVLDHGGRVYLAKDALLAPPDFERMYPELPQFRPAAAEMDPRGRMESDLSRRLQLRSGV